MELILIFLAWFLYAIIEGVSEGAYWQYKFESNHYKPQREHSIWTIQRSIVVFIASLYLGSLWHIFLFALTFPFLHDGFYYLTRRYLSKKGVYQKGFWDFSTKSTAWFTKYSTVFLRTTYFIVGLIIIAYLIIK